MGNYNRTENGRVNWEMKRLSFFEKRKKRVGMKVVLCKGERFENGVKGR